MNDIQLTNLLLRNFASKFFPWNFMIYKSLAIPLELRQVNLRLLPLTLQLAHQAVKMGTVHTIIRLRATLVDV